MIPLLFFKTVSSTSSSGSSSRRRSSESSRGSHCSGIKINCVNVLSDHEIDKQKPLESNEPANQLSDSTLKENIEFKTETKIDKLKNVDVTKEEKTSTIIPKQQIVKIKEEEKPVEVQKKEVATTSLPNGSEIKIDCNAAIKKDDEKEIKVHITKTPNEVARQLNFNSDTTNLDIKPIKQEATMTTTPVKQEHTLQQTPVKIEAVTKIETNSSTTQAKNKMETLMMPSPALKTAITSSTTTALSHATTSTQHTPTNNQHTPHHSYTLNSSSSVTNSTLPVTPTSSSSSSSSKSATSSRRSSSGSSSHTHHHHHHKSSSSNKHSSNSSSSTSNNPSSSSSSTSRSRECSRCYKRSKIRRASVGTQCVQHAPAPNVARTSRNNSHVPAGLEHLKYGQYFEVEVYPNGGASVVHLYQDEIQNLSPDEMEELVNEFFEVCFAEDEDGYARHVMGIVHDAARYLPDLLEHMAENYSTLTVKAGVLGRNSDIETCTMSQYYEQV